MTEKVILSGYVTAPKADLAAILTTLPEHIRRTRAEPGCVIFRVKQDTANPLRFDVYEEFVNESAFTYHQERFAKGDWARVTINMERHFSVLVE